MSVGLPSSGIAKRLRSAPACGYDTEAKSDYRRAVWSAVADDDGSVPVGDIILLPSSEGVEIDVAIERGVDSARIVCVDRSAAVIATSRWRKRHPDIRFFASEIGSVGTKLSKVGARVGFANLDLCGQVSGETVEQIKSFLCSAPLLNDFLLGITIARGREGRVLTALMKSLPYAGAGPSCPRLRALCRMCGLVSGKDQRVTVRGEGAYTSGRHPMGWVVLSVERFADDWRLAEMEDAKECFEDVCERVLGWVCEGEATHPRDELNETLEEAVWELVEALDDVDGFWTLPRARRRALSAWMGEEYDLDRHEWKTIANLCRHERRRRLEYMRFAERIAA